MSKEWPALGQNAKPNKKFSVKANSFAAAVKFADLGDAAEGPGRPQPSGAAETQPVAAGLSWEDKKAAVRAAKFAQKEEKRIKRDENARRKLIAPKGYRLQLIQSSSANLKTESRPASDASFSETSFPMLGEAPLKIPPRVEAAVAAPSVANVLDSIIQDPPVLVSKKKKPEKVLMLDLEQLLERSAARKAVVAKKKKVKIKRIAFEEKLSGNPLDSSQPVRHRGKVREVPKKKRKTSLKTAIFAYRHIKKVQREKAEELGTITETKEISAEVPEKENSEEIPENLVIKTENLEELQFTQSDVMHSRKFREYCDNVLSKELDESLQMFLKSIAAIQNKSFQKDPTKHKKRIVSGLHETKKFIVANKVKILVIAPDLEKCPEPGGLDFKIAELVSLCKETSTPYAFALGRRKLGKLLFKKVPVSCAAVINSDGAETVLQEPLSAVLEILPSAKDAYQTTVSSNKLPKSVPTQSPSDVNKLVVTSLLSALEESLQTPKQPEFLRVIDSIQCQTEDESD